MEIERVIKILKGMKSRFLGKPWEDKIGQAITTAEQRQALTSAIEILQRIDVDGIKNIIEKNRWEYNVEILNGTATNKAAENYARAVIKYLKGEK